MEELNSSKLASGSTQSWPLWGACPACTAGGGSKAARRRAPAAGLRYSWQACAAPTCAIQLATVCCTHSPLVSWRRGQSTVLRESCDAGPALGQPCKQNMSTMAGGGAVPNTAPCSAVLLRCCMHMQPLAQQCCCGAACTLPVQKNRHPLERASSDKTAASGAGVPTPRRAAGQAKPPHDCVPQRALQGAGSRAIRASKRAG